VEDLDGKLSTTGDQSPVEDWPFDLLIDGVAQGITQTTGLDGCTTWSELTSGINYGVAEELPEGWRALTGTEKSFGPAVSAGAYSHTFINTQKTGTFVYLPMVIK